MSHHMSACIPYYLFLWKQILYKEELSLNLTTSLSEAMCIDFLNFDFSSKDF